MASRLPPAIERLDGRADFWQRASRTSSTSAPRRYRIGNLAELLHGATVVVRTRPEASVFRDARVIVCSRPALDGDTLSVLERCRQAGSLLVADFDDLWFDGDVSDWPDVVAGQLSRAAALRRQAAHRDALGLFDAFTVSTEVLADALRAVTSGARVRVVPNGVSLPWRRQGLLLYPPPAQRPRVIRYLPGSRHDHDFRACAPALGRFMRRHEEARLEVLGPCGPLPREIPVERQKRLPRVPFDHLPEYLGSSWLTLAPLVESPFNRAKSAIKFLESAAFGTPCIASPIADMKEHQAGGVELPDSDPAWEEALERLLEPSEHRRSQQLGLDWVAAHGTAERSVRALLGALAEWAP